MKWLDDLIDGANAAPEPIAEPPKVLTVWVQTRLPANGDLGHTEAGWYFVEDGVVVLCEESGEPCEGQTHKLAKGEDAKQIAGRLRLRVWRKEEQGASDFNRPLRYGPVGVA
jgi:hypothetical protein